MKKKIIVGLSGASGIIYGIRALEHLQRHDQVETHLVMSGGARTNIAIETDYKPDDVKALADVVHRNDNLAASIASGSFRTDGMLVAPCSMKTLSGIANSYADNLLVPTADDNRIFIAERIDSEADAEDMVDKLRRQVTLFKVESEISKKLARNKQIEMEAVLAQAEEVAHVDPLTFLPNRRTIIKDMQSEVMRAERYRSFFSISVVDIDNFKAINDNYGHPIGDEVLRYVALQLRDSIRHPDVVGRYGGEEFIILLPNSDKNAATEQAARLCRHIRTQVVHTKDADIQVTISIGIAQFMIGEDSWHSLLKRADNAMFEAKKLGRDRWFVGD